MEEKGKTKTNGSDRKMDEHVIELIRKEGLTNAFKKLGLKEDILTKVEMIISEPELDERFISASDTLISEVLNAYPTKKQIREIALILRDANFTNAADLTDSISRVECNKNYDVLLNLVKCLSNPAWDMFDRMKIAKELSAIAKMTESIEAVSAAAECISKYIVTERSRRSGMSDDDAPGMAYELADITCYPSDRMREAYHNDHARMVLDTIRRISRYPPEEARDIYRQLKLERLERKQY